VALEKPEIGISNPNIPMDNNCTNDKLHFGMPGGSVDYKVEGDESDVSDAIPTVSPLRWPATEREMVVLGTRAYDRYECKDGDYADADE
jgi:hypothetical protein